MNVEFCHCTKSPYRRVYRCDSFLSAILFASQNEGTLLRTKDGVRYVLL
jgi:hypothetical protein